MNEERPAIQRARDALRSLRRVTVAVSGGVDSMTLAHLAHGTDGVEACMVHALSAAVPGDGTERVREAAAREGWALRVIDAGEFDDPRYVANPVNRCYYCKSALYGSMRTLAGAAKKHGAQLVSGTNLDDLDDYRPGLLAAAERSVVHPFVDARCTKADVRAIAAKLGLESLSALPASPCLSSRIETGIAIDPATLAAVHAAETQVRARFGPGTVRCRVRAGANVVLELDPASLDALDANARETAQALVGACFDGCFDAGATVSLAPYLRGSAFVHAPQPA